MQGFCRRLIVRVVSDDELSNPEFVRDVRTFAAALPLCSYQWLTFLEDTYRDFLGRIVCVNGETLELDIDTAFFPNLDLESVSEKEMIDARERVRFWFRDFLKPIAEESAPHIKAVARERVRVVATLLRARFPKESALWGVRAANDNYPPEPSIPALSGNSPGC